MNRRVAVISAAVGGVCGLTAFGAVALAFNSDDGTTPAAPEVTTTVVVPTTSTTVEPVTSTTEAAALTPTTVIVVQPAPQEPPDTAAPPSPPDTSGDLSQRVTKVEKRVQTIESTLVAEKPPSVTMPTAPPSPPQLCSGHPVESCGH